MSAIGQPTSATSSWRSSSCSLSIASCSCSRHFWRNAWLRRPVGLVERAPCGGDGALHVVGRRVGDLAEHLLGGGVDVVEALARRGFDQLAVDEHADLALHGAGAVGFDRGHVVLPVVLVGAQR